MENIVLSIAQLNEALATIKASFDTLAIPTADVTAQLEVMAKAKYDEGFAAGVASAATPGFGDKTQADIDKAVSEAVTPLSAEIDALKVRVSELETLLLTAPADAVAAFKAQLLTQYEIQQVVESEQETGFRALLT